MPILPLNAEFEADFAVLTSSIVVDFTKPIAFDSYLAEYSRVDAVSSMSGGRFCR
jgi:hypothetical protein